MQSFVYKGPPDMELSDIIPRMKHRSCERMSRRFGVRRCASGRKFDGLWETGAPLLDLVVEFGD